MTKYLTCEVRRRLQCVLALTVLMPLVSFGVTQGPLTGSPGDPPLPLNGVWQGPFDEFLSPPLGFFPEVWTFNGPGEVQITDLYFVGDMYRVYDNNVLIGTSSAVPTSGGPWTSDPAVGWASSSWSHFDAVLGAGSHSITLELIQLPSGFSDGTYSIRGLAVAAPDSGPGVLGLVAIVGVAVVGTRIRRVCNV